MRYVESESDPKVNKELHEQIDLFLDEFMNEEYKVKDHIVAREHYSKVFHEILPKYLESSAIIVCKSTAPSEAQEVLR